MFITTFSRSNDATVEGEKAEMVPDYQLEYRDDEILGAVQNWFDSFWKGSESMPLPTPDYEKNGETYKAQIAFFPPQGMGEIFTIQINGMKEDGTPVSAHQISIGIPEAELTATALDAYSYSYGEPSLFGIDDWIAILNQSAQENQTGISE